MSAGKSTQLVTEIAEAYGKFIMNFTALESALEVLLLNVAEVRDLETYRKLHKKGFSKKLSMLNGLVEALPDDFTRASLKASCERIEKVAAWRNERVHARVDPEDWRSNDITHYHFHDLKALSWDRAEIENMTQEVMRIGQLGFWTAHSEIQANQRWKQMFDKLWDELDDDQATSATGA
jgi:hypothetical protein